jgi:hypothetical protein
VFAIQVQEKTEECIFCLLIQTFFYLWFLHSSFQITSSWSCSDSDHKYMETTPWKRQCSLHQMLPKVMCCSYCHGPAAIQWFLWHSVILAASTSAPIDVSFYCCKLTCYSNKNHYCFSLLSVSDQTLLTNLTPTHYIGSPLKV